MHINTVFHKELRKARAWSTFAGLEWKTRQQVLATLSSLAAQALIEAASLPERAEQQVTSLSGELLIGELAGQSLKKWARHAD